MPAVGQSAGTVWSLISAVPCQATTPALQRDPALSRPDAVLCRMRRRLMTNDFHRTILGPRSTAPGTARTNALP